MKKVVFVLLSVLIFVTFCACSNNSMNETATESQTQKQDTIAADASKTEMLDRVMTVKIGNEAFTAKLYDNETAKTFSKMLPLTVHMNELHGNEKYYYLTDPLPADSSGVGKINKGDIMLYGNDCLVLFYDSFPTEYSYTKIGYVENTADLANAAGDGNVTITFEK